MKEGGDAGYLGCDLLERVEDRLYRGGEEYEGLERGVEGEVLEGGVEIRVEEGGDGGGVEIRVRELEDELALVQLTEEERGEVGDSVGRWIAESLLGCRGMLRERGSCARARD